MHQILRRPRCCARPAPQRRPTWTRRAGGSRRKPPRPGSPLQIFVRIAWPSAASVESLVRVVESKRNESARAFRPLAQPSADALPPRAGGPPPLALGVRGSDADARRPIDPGQGVRRRSSRHGFRTTRRYDRGCGTRTSATCARWVGAASSRTSCRPGVSPRSSSSNESPTSPPRTTGPSSVSTTTI